MLQTVNSVRSREKSLVTGYLMVNYDKYIPLEIIKLCILYCFILEEFDINSSSKTIVSGINNTITNFEAAKTSECVFGRNTHKPSGKYHWTFKISNFLSSVMSFGFIQNNQICNDLYRLHVFNFCSKKKIFHVYMDADKKIAAFSNDDQQCTIQQLINFDNINRFRFCVRAIKGNVTIELIAFNNSNWYITQSSHNITDLTANIGYAGCVYDINEKLKHYSIGLQYHPNMELWNDEYLRCLLILQQYDTAYIHALQYKKGQTAIQRLASHFYFRKELKKALKLYKLLQYELLEITEIEHDNLYYKMGYCYRRGGETQKALNLFKLHVDRFPNDVKGYNQISCVYDDCKDFDNGKKYALKALELSKNDDDKALMLTNIGVNAYYQGQLNDAIKYTKEAIQYIPRYKSAVDRSNLGKYYYKSKNYEESYKYLLEAVSIDAINPDINGNYGVLLYYLKKVEESLIYLEKCLSKRQVVDDRELIVDCLYIVAQILYDKGEFDKSIDECLKVIDDHDFDDYKNKDQVYYLISNNFAKLSQYDKSIEYLVKAKQFQSK